MPVILSGRRFIQNQHFRIQYQNRGNRDPLLLSETQCRNRPVFELINAADLHDPHHAFFDLRLRNLPDPKAERNLVIDHRLRDHLIRVLKHDADVLRAFRYGKLRKIRPVHHNASGVRYDKTGQDMRQGRFSGAVLSDDGDHLSFIDVCADMVQNRYLAIIAVGNVVDFEQRLPFRFLCHIRIGFVPFQKFFRTPAHVQRVQGSRLHIRCNIDARIPACGKIQRFTDAVLRQDIACQHVVRRIIRDDSSVIDQNHPVDRAVQHILNTMLNDDDRLAGITDFIDQFDGNLAGPGVQVCERFIK